MRKIGIIVIFSLRLFGAFELQQLNSEIIGNGGIFSLHPFGGNPAVFSNHKLSLSSNYTNLFGLEDLHCWDFGIQYSLNATNSLNIKTNSVGDKIYHENTFSIGYGRKLSIPVSIGLSISYYNLSVQTFESQHSLGIGGGICYYLNDGVTMSTIFGNINQPKICNQKEALPEFFAVALRWQINPIFIIKGELFKDTLYPFSSRFGSEINLNQSIQLFSGLQTNPDRFSGGLAIRFSNIKFISSIQTHLKLPVTYYFGCSFFIK